MARTIDSSMLAKLESGELKPFYLLEMIIGNNSYRFTDCDVPLALPDDIVGAVEDLTLSVDGSIGGASNSVVPGVFTPISNLKFSPIRYSLARIVDKADIEMSMVENPAMLYEFVGGTPQGSKVILRLVIIDDDNISMVGDTSFTLFEGSIDQWNMTEDTLQFTAVSAISQWSQKGLRTHGSSCQWKKFKGQTKDSPCMYSGGQSWCDRTYARCEQLNNTDNFGGFRWLPSIVDKDIWWGREKK